MLVFTQYVAMARLIDRHLDRPRRPRRSSCTAARRWPSARSMVDRFQSGEVPVFLLSLKAAGTGLNLTRAGHVVHFDRWWNPAVEEQATDRAYRIGQTQPVQVHRLIAEGTVEDRIAEMLDAKRALADAVLGSGEAALTELTDARAGRPRLAAEAVMTPRTARPAPLPPRDRRARSRARRPLGRIRPAGGATPGWRPWRTPPWTGPPRPRPYVRAPRPRRRDHRHPRPHHGVRPGQQAPPVPYGDPAAGPHRRRVGRRS